MPDTLGNTLRLGLRVPSALGTGIAAIGQIIDRCGALGIRTVTLEAETVEAWLCRPLPIVPLEPPPEDGLSTGLLELEEDVLRDSYELARSTFDAELRRWRLTTSLVPLADIRRRLAAAELEVIGLDWRAIDLRSDDEMDYGCRVTAAIGADSLFVPYSYDAARRVPAVGERNGTEITLSCGPDTPLAAFDDALSQSPRIYISVDLTGASDGRTAELAALISRTGERVRSMELALGSADHTEEHILATLRLGMSPRWPAILIVSSHTSSHDETELGRLGERLNRLATAFSA